MLEIELKCPCADLEALEKRLVALGAEPTGDLEQNDVYFIHPCRDFVATDEALRVRRQGDGSTLHYKGPRVDLVTKTREEIGVPLVDEGAMMLVLERLGFRSGPMVIKSRRTFLLHGVEVSLDRVQGLDGYVELEIMGDDLESGRKRLLRLRDLLGLRGSEMRSYLDLIETQTDI